MTVDSYGAFGEGAACLPLMREVPEGRREGKRPIFRFLPTEAETAFDNAM